MYFRRTINRLCQKASWMFRPVAPRPEPFYKENWAFGLVITFFVTFFLAGITASSYYITKWLFIATWFCAVIALWIALAALNKGARLLWTSFLSILVAILLFAIYAVMCPTVTISPQKVVFGSISKSNGFSETHRFRIQNKSDSDIYSITFYLRVESSIVPRNEFKFDVPKSSQKPVDENTATGRGRIGDISGMDCTDVKNRPVFVRLIAHLAPGDSREVTLTRINPYAESIPPSAGMPAAINMPNDSAGIVVSAAVSNFSDDSASSLNRPGMQMEGPLRIGEAMKCDALGVLWLKE